MNIASPLPLIRPPTVRRRRRPGVVAPDRDWRLALVTALQTTLDPEVLVVLFSAKVAELVPHRGLRLVALRGGPVLVAGNEEQCSDGHRLVLERANLGEVTFSRGERFSSAEAAVLESALADLAHPLHNALMYREALAAAARDPLTGAGNRTGLEATLAREVELTQRHGTPLSVIMIDVDHFKAVNDRFGHLAGDAVLERFANRVRSCIRSSDALFRFGGEEFAVLASNTPLDGAALLAERVRAVIAGRPLDTSAGRVVVTASFGVVCHRHDESAVDLFARADSALYAAKAAGRDCVATGRSCGRQSSGAE